MFIINLFGFIMISSTIVIGVLFFSKASALEKEIELELLAAAKHAPEKESGEDYDLSDSNETGNTDEASNQNDADYSDHQEEEQEIV